MVLQHFLSLFFRTFVLEVVLDKLSILFEESLQPAIVSPYRINCIKHLIVGLEIRLPAAPTLNILSITNNTKILQIN